MEQNVQSKQGIIATIRKHRSFLISSHVNPEGDSLGSALALQGLLRKLGKKAYVVMDGEIPPVYRFLPGASGVLAKAPKGCEAAFIVDCPVLRRIGRVEGFISKEKPLGVIDHHVSNERFGTVNWVDPNAAAVGEMIFSLFKALRVKISREDAVNLYVSVVGDTGSFRYSNTTPKIHRLVASLIALGVDPSDVTHKLYESYSFDSRRLLAATLETLKIDRNGKIAWLKVTRKMLFRHHSSAEETEGFVDFARSIKGVEAAVFFREEKEGGVKISFRSKGKVDVNRIARRFGGGGHRAASGCFIRASLSRAEAMVLRETRKSFSK